MNRGNTIKNPRKLASFVYRWLIVRLLLVMVGVSLLLSAAVVARKRVQVRDAVREAALIQLDMLEVQVEEAILEQNQDPEQALRDVVEVRRGRRTPLSLGSFVYASVSDGQGVSVVVSEEDDFPGMSDVTAYIDGNPAVTAQPHITATLVRLDDHPYVRLMGALNWEKMGDGYQLDAMFAVSDHALAAMRKDLARSIGWATAIAAIVIIVLYPVILTLTRRLSDSSEALLDSHLQLLQTLGSAISKRDSDTSAHNFRVTLMAVRLAETLGLDNPSIRKLIMGAYLHDVGKIGTPDNILLKPGKLTDPEFEIMKKHVDHGIDIVSRPDDETKGWVTDAIEVVAGHHEKFNGKGYPSGISAEAIPLVARIFSVADVFDALTCRRPYKEPFPFEKSIGIIMSDKGTSFDPRVVDAFATIAEDLYSKIAGREDERLPEELDDVIRRYFKAGLESLYI